MMKQTSIIDWLNYWKNINMVDIDEIRAFDQVHLARKYCSCMRTGIFTPDAVTDLEIWRALQVMRGNRPEWQEISRQTIECAYDEELARHCAKDARALAEAMATWNPWIDK